MSTELVLIKNIGSLVTTRRLSAAGTGAETAGSASTVTGATINRFALGSPQSVELAILFDTTLASTDTLGFQITVQHSLNGSTWTTYAASTTTANTLNGTISSTLAAYTTAASTPSAGTVPAAVGVSGGGAQQGSQSMAVDLSGAEQYVRVTVLPVFSAASTDTCTFVIAGTFAGQDRLPATI